MRYPYLALEMPHVKKIIYETTDITSLQELAYLDASIATHSFYNAAVSRYQTKYPVLIFSHGLGSYIARLYTSVLEDLATHGYIVVAIDHTYDNLVTFFPSNRAEKYIFEGVGGVLDEPSECSIEEGKQLKIIENEHLNIWVHDVQFVLNELEKINQHDPQGILTGSLDLLRIGVFGHSYGGATAAQVCRIDSRCKAGIDIDGALHENKEKSFNKPFMIVVADTFLPPSNKMLAQAHKTRAEFETLCAAGYLKQHLPPIENLFKNLTHDAYLIHFTTAIHESFGDYAFLLPPQRKDVVDPLKGIEITRNMVRGFFDVYLKRSNRSQFIAMLRHYPELTMQSK